MAFADNDSACCACIRGRVPSVAIRDILAAIAAENADWLVPSWDARCLGPSNIADGPSRPRFEEVASVFPDGHRLEVTQLESLASFGVF